VIECRAGACRYLRFERLGREPAVVHAVFTRHGGVSAPPFASLNGSVASGDDPAAVRRNREIMAGVVRLPLVGARPVHGANIVEVRPPTDRAEADGDWRERLAAVEADAMMTDVPGVALFWAYADCIPVLFYDPRHRVVAMAHAGWRGTARAIAPRTVRAMARRYGTRPAELLAGLAPGIGECCYAVTEEVRERFRAEPAAWRSARFEERADADGVRRLYVDLHAANRRQLLAAGLLPEHVEVSDLCTGCRTDLFYSYRVERRETGRFGVAIGLAPRAAGAEEWGDGHRA
jgi:YfiH family protein